MSTDFKNGKQIYSDYFKNKPALPDLERAYYAYHKPHHRFLNSDGIEFDIKSNFHDDVAMKRFADEKCIDCGFSRSQVRWGDTPVLCEKRRGQEYIERTLHSEELTYCKKLNDSEGAIKALFKNKYKSELSANFLFKMATERGYDADLVINALGFEQEIERLMPEVEALLSAHKQRGKETSNWGK